MRILYSHYLPFIDQPAGYMIQAIAQELRHLGHEVLIHASAGSHPAPAVWGAPGSKSFVSLRQKLWFAKAIAKDRIRHRRELAAIKRFQPHVLLVRQDPYCVSMTRAGRRLGVPVVTYADAPAAYEARHRNDHRRWHPAGLVEGIEKWGLRHSAAVIVVSHPAAETLRSYDLPVPIHVVPNGIDPHPFTRLTADEQLTERKRLGLSASIVVGFQGSFQGFHGIDRLRDLMLWTAGRRDVQWLLIGDGPEKQALQDVVCSKVPALFLGRQPHARVAKLLGIVDIALAPYTQVPGVFFGCPLKVLEYAAAGCAILASDQGDIPFLLNDGKAGIVLPTNDAKAWQKELGRLLEDTPHREQLRRRARDWAGRQLTWEHTAKKVSDLLGTVVKPQRITGTHVLATV